MCKPGNYQGPFSALLGACVLSFVYFLWVAPSSAESFSPAKADPTASQNFTVSTNDGLVSVKATEAPLKDVIEQIGQELSISVDAQVADDDTVTDEFQGLLLDEVLQRLAPNYAIITGKDDKKITKIVILPKGEVAPDMPRGKKVAITPGSQGMPVNDSKDPDRPEPFRFEFDPSAVMERRMP